MTDGPPAKRPNRPRRSTRATTIRVAVVTLLATLALWAFMVQRMAAGQDPGLPNAQSSTAVAGSHAGSRAASPSAAAPAPVQTRAS